MRRARIWLYGLVQVLMITASTPASHADELAARVGVEIMMFNGPGWSQSGGPWIKPEQSMRRVTWSEYPAKGGNFSQVVRSGGNPVVQDIAVLAVPKKQAPPPFFRPPVRPPAFPTAFTPKANS